MAYTTINKSTDYFNTKLYTGNSSTNNITGVGFQPDWVWMKNRGALDSHYLYDAVRGVTKNIYSNLTSAEGTASNGLTAFGTDGFTLGNEGDINGNGNNYVSWNWLANNTSGSSNTDGSITSTVSVNTTSGFSIVKYTGNATAGATIGHGLGVVPNVIIVKKLNNTTNWSVYHSGLGNFAKVLSLNTSSAATTDSGVWDNVPTSSTFLVGSDNTTNANGDNYIAYCFAEKQGFSKFSSYVGNSGNNADAPFIYTGFKPAFVLIKNTVQASAWEMYDNKRDGFNPQVHGLRANENVGEDNTDDLLDLLSNGFKLRHQGGGLNETGDTFIYMAFAEQPLVSNSGTDGVPATAR